METITVKQIRFNLREVTVFILVIMATLLFATNGFTQEKTEEKDKRPVRSPFESALLIDNQSVVVPIKGTFEFDMQHRFGTVENGISDIYGLYAPSANIRLGFTYSVIKNLSIGFGTTKLDKMQDFSFKYAIFQQTRSGSFPVGITYYANTVIDAQDKSNFEKYVHRLSYFHELIISRKFGSKLSVQVAPNFSHYNAVDTLMNNDVIGISAAGRYKLNAQLSLIVGYDQQLTKHKTVDALTLESYPEIDIKPNISFGLEIATSAHAFQVFAGSFRSINPQHNMLFNTNDFGAGDILIGFNITRLWNF
ncbi:MAG: DUF5777 family beta-barrel protein [Cyclobacteriaceae bacterium]|nr:DUF5777 family beta-barrel protein [Cyclobacteriaceae bacterium]